MERAITFDDVLIVPQYSTIESRDDVDISTKLGSIKIDIPIISAPMDSVTEHTLASEMIKAGAGAIIHRYNSIEDQTKEVIETISSTSNKQANYLIGITVGVKDIQNQVDRISGCLDQLTDILTTEQKLTSSDIKVLLENHFMITIDIAHGDHKKLYLVAEKIKKQFPKITLCAGNICTTSAALKYKELGIDIAKIGVGPGHVCSTRLVTGCGFPQLEAIMEISDTGIDIPIIADGGIKNSGDIVKALAAGASAVMIGSLFASCPESCAQQIQDEKGNKFKVYRGMASYSAKKDNQINDKYVEGESIIKRLSEPVKNILERLEAGIRSGFSYVGARNIEELQRKATFIEVSQGSHLENSVRGS